MVELNDYYQGLIREADSTSPWQYYMMIGTQWSFYPRFFSINGEDLDPRPKILANSVLETYEQSTSNCIGCHSFATFKAGEGDSKRNYNSDFLFTVDIDDQE